jgi:O-antigen ligase
MEATRFVRDEFNATSVAFLSAISVAALLHTTVCNVLLILYCCLWLYNRYYCGPRPEAWHYIFIFIFCSYYILGLIGLIHTDDMRQGLHWLEAKWPFFGLPVFIALSNLTDRDIDRILTFFSIALVVIGLILLVPAMDAYSITREASAFTYINLLGPLSLHPSYFSLFAGFGIMHLYARRKTITRSALEKVFLFTAITLLVLFNFLALSRAGIFGFMLVLVGFFVFKLLAGKAKSVSFWVLLGVLTVLIIVTIPVIKERFKLFEISDPLGEETTNSTAFHIKSWYCAAESLSDYHFFTGYGTGDEKDVLVSCYEKYNWRIMVAERHHAHNEYLSMMMRHGIIGLLVFLTMLIYPLWLAFKAKEFVYFGFIVLFGTLCLAGSLNLYHGITIYSLLNALLFRKTILWLKAAEAGSPILQSEVKLASR